MQATRLTPRPRGVSGSSSECYPRRFGKESRRGAVANHHRIYYLWRPFLSDPGDDMILELAVTAECAFSVTYNQSDFVGVEQFGLISLTPKEFLQKIGVVS